MTLPATLIDTAFETLTLDSPAEYVLRVTLNRPQAANAMNTQMGHDLTAVFERLSVDVEGYRCVILTGAGEKAFCAGGDLKERKGMSDETWGAQHLVFERMVRALIGCPLPLIGAVNGAAYGGGCEIAAAMDFVYAADTARFALTEVTLGIIPGAGGTQNLPRAVGQRRAMEIILTGTPFTAAEAKEWGLVNTVSAPADLANDVVATAARIAGNAPVSIRQAKQAIRRGMQMSLADGLAFEIEAYNRTVPTKDRQEGILAFNEKRKPVFRGN
ncbi:enoyl-CoA hydratase-related protein [Fodinicurvata sp. EGI_FJ10296]|uniref:enoyl-CoA hydratase/isomerase family protein n=1 Tax=Fodinicurvata sp. EGI_FJ10296 TaxID=3231908 RepID=UPI00345193B2